MQICETKVSLRHVRFPRISGIRINNNVGHPGSETRERAQTTERNNNAEHLYVFFVRYENATGRGCK